MYIWSKKSNEAEDRTRNPNQEPEQKAYGQRTRRPNVWQDSANFWGLRTLKGEKKTLSNTTSNFLSNIWEKYLISSKGMRSCGSPRWYSDISWMSTSLPSSIRCSTHKVFISSLTKSMNTSRRHPSWPWHWHSADTHLEHVQQTAWRCRESQIPNVL